jgi:lipopolysaccharide/colanic/teichoic acid biosynthesis glycosyltransferase
MFFAEKQFLFHTTKRVIDMIGATIGLIVCTPVLIGCACWIKITDGGPVFYRQWRVGHDGWMFQIVKLRTMSLNAETIGDAQFASDRDPRVIRGCNWMRKSHVDELPQFWNILTGHMSLVGPRPERPEMLEILRGDIPKIDQRLAAKPGLTGLAQIRNGYTNDIEGARRKLAYDLQYLRDQSIWTDIRLIVQTLPRLWDNAAM